MFVSRCVLERLSDRPLIRLGFSLVAGSLPECIGTLFADSLVLFVGLGISCCGRLSKSSRLRKACWLAPPGVYNASRGRRRRYPSRDGGGELVQDQDGLRLPTNQECGDGTSAGLARQPGKRAGTVLAIARSPSILSW